MVLRAVALIADRLDESFCEVLHFQRWQLAEDKAIECGFLLPVEGNFRQYRDEKFVGTHKFLHCALDSDFLIIAFKSLETLAHSVEYRVERGSVFPCPKASVEVLDLRGGIDVGIFNYLDKVVEFVGVSFPCKKRCAVVTLEIFLHFVDGVDEVYYKGLLAGLGSVEA